MKAIVLFDTLFGNTEKIANCLAKGLREAGVDAQCVSIKVVELNRLSEYDLLAVGAPTQYFTASKPMKEFLSRLNEIDLKGKAGFAFDTKLDSTLSGSAAKYIEKRLNEFGLDIIKPRKSAIVTGQQEKKNATKVGESMIKDGMEHLFWNVGKELGALLEGRSRMVGAK